MAGRIPENILEDILSRVDIVEVIAGYIPLKRAGRNFKAVCPFHHEKTASFVVSPDRQIFHCFGCHTGGNAFRFLMQYERLDFPEAVRTLAKKAGVALPEVERQDTQAANLITQLYKINEWAALFYSHNLNTPEAQVARSYLIKRGIKPPTAHLFRLGFALDKWDALTNHLRAKDVHLALLEKAGLVLPKEGGGYYDRFRQRIIFPIADIKSRPLGFGARVLPAPSKVEGGETLPKYINSPETPVYTKGRNLYGLNLSHEAIREKDYAVIVEGYLDFIIPYQEGLQNLVASQGTALTYEQARLLKRYTRNAVIVYDADSAGELASLRSLDIFIEEEMNVRVVSLPQGYDPDLFVRKNGIEKFQEKVEQADTLFDYKMKVLKSRYNPQSVEGKSAISSEMLSTINKFKNAVAKSEYIKLLAEGLSVDEDALLQDLKKIKEPRMSPGAYQPNSRKAVDINPTEKLLLKLMLEETDVIHRIKDTLEPADFQDERTCRVVSIIFDLIQQGKSIEPQHLVNHLDEEEVADFVCELAVSADFPTQDREKVVDDCIKRIKGQRLRLRKESLCEEIKAAQQVGDEERLNRLMQEFQHLSHIKKESG
jgi:DNA primase